MGFILRIILWAVIIYFFYQFFRNILVGKNSSPEQPGNANVKVHGGAPSKPPLDLSNRDIEDAVYKDIHEDKNN
jgi:hypothetical protein